MKDKIELLIAETGCERGEAELALEMCGFDVEQAARAIPRLFHNIAVVKGKIYVESETLYILFLAILNLRNRALIRTRAVASYNPVVFSARLDQNWFQFERHLYACRLRVGSLQPLSQDVELFLSRFFGSREAAPFHSETARSAQGKAEKILASALSGRFQLRPVKVEVRKDILDMGQFQEVVGHAHAASEARSEKSRTKEEGFSLGVPKPLVLRIALEGRHDGLPAEKLRAGDLIYAQIIDSRDIAQYLAKVLGNRARESLLVPVEAVERVRSRDVCVRVRFSRGVCGDVTLPSDIRIQVVSRVDAEPWWKKIIG